MIRTLAQQSLQFLGICLYRAGLARWIIARSRRVRAVLYHAVENQSGSYTQGLGINVPPDTFTLHLEYYQQFYDVVSMREYLQSQHSADGTPTVARLLITFDDGYASVLEHALPLLEAQKMPAITYLIGKAVRGRMVWVNRLNQALNDYPGQAREVLSTYPGVSGLSRRGLIHRIQTRFTPAQITALTDRLEDTIPGLTFDSEKVFLTPNDIRQMQHRGMEFGFHTNDHWNLEHCRDSELVATLATNGLDSLINSRTFAYPFGYFAPSAIGRLQRQGYERLMTVGSNNDRFCRLHLDRTEMFETSFAALFARLEVQEPVFAALRAAYYRCKAKMSRVHTGRAIKRA